MAFLLKVDISDWKDADHESLLDKMNPSRELVPGLTEIISVETEKGLTVFQVWETQEGAEMFGKAAAEVFKNLGGETEIHGFPISHLYR